MKMQNAKCKMQNAESKNIEARGKRQDILFLSSCFLLLTSCFLLFAPPVQAKGEKDIQKIERVVIFPFENISGNFDAPAVINSLIEKELKNRGFQAVPYEQVDRFLSKRKIRYTGAVDRITTIELNRELGADAVIIGSIDLYSSFSNDIYVGVTLRLVGTRDCSILYMDTISYAGSDFRGLLGFGSFKSVDKLGEVIIASMVKEMPKEYLFENREDNFLEFGSVKISPLIVRGGEDTKILVRIIPVTEKPLSVQAHIGGEKFDLKNGNGDYYDGEITAPGEDGLYTIDIIAALSDGRTSKFSSAGMVKVDAIPPVVTISTNKDITAGFVKKDAILFTLKSNEEIERWDVEIVDKDNKYVRGGKGFGVLPPQLIWKGENDAGGKNSDGVYNLKLSVWDVAGNMGVFQKKIILDTTPPAVKIEVETSDNNDEVTFNLDYEIDEKMEKWEFIVLGENSKFVKSLSGKGNVDKRIVIPLTSAEGVVDSAKIMYTFRAIDIAGNVFETSNQKVVLHNKKEEKFAKKKEGLTSAWDTIDF
ncbi:MAG: hypothetical protein A3I04_01325 [Nitrospinae bacterium RIFCSPLOWO2_02_FULL_39_110]|nr:MAG: hypothetical protein A3D97_00135 [Nitrospinae bacterium RIFCSPHIGHO2_12_FULL_39_42]OGW01357.1 MAG: hypothetical protein A3D20_03525 [Nitrospinae bacterium RIFCSPHIGHO2_02_FULL_39_82]OGW02823.1 MAG: hypothetical protein A2Z59_02335 [Nitrospinae bacterium RIFCSPLOWO2_02_39_17]OGW04005.1 MAG: hypothetical protein A3I04_01325 [Nitrospinae bacterium RIFCSPLOWO2_02_FULL_39_110]OGW09109.1 MAG: hypothetical protein A3F81_07095 [Nitrospinae bacterium RIFCSPLOWO2_12_FULL_39_93]OGW10172.1 MAG: hy